LTVTVTALAHDVHSKVRASRSTSSVGPMDDTNIGAPHLGHRRCILGGNIRGSKLCGCGMVRPLHW